MNEWKIGKVGKTNGNAYAKYVYASQNVLFYYPDFPVRLTEQIVTHETIHRVIHDLEGVRVCKRFDNLRKMQNMTVETLLAVHGAG